MVSWSTTANLCSVGKVFILTAILARPVHFRHLLWAKLLLMQISCPVLALVCLPFLLVFASELLVTYSVFLLYNIGFSTACMLFFATMNRKRLYISPSSFFNQQEAPPCTIC